MELNQGHGYLVRSSRWIRAILEKNNPGTRLQGLFNGKEAQGGRA